MRQAKILNTAVLAAKAASGMKDPDAPDMRPLYNYALERRAIDREKRLPSPEVLARKFGEISGQPFPHPSLDAAPEELQAFFVTFRAVIEALDPFREDEKPDDIGDGASAPEAEEEKPDAEAGAENKKSKKQAK